VQRSEKKSFGFVCEPFQFERIRCSVGSISRETERTWGIREKKEVSAEKAPTWLGKSGEFNRFRGGGKVKYLGGKEEETCQFFRGETFRVTQKGGRGPGGKKTETETFRKERKPQT